MNNKYVQLLAGLLLLIMVIRFFYSMWRDGNNDDYAISRRNYFKKNKKKASDPIPVKVNLLDILLKLMPEYVVISEYERNDFGTDYMVIGRTGVFIIESKDVRGTIDITENHMLLDGKHVVDNFIMKVKNDSNSIKSDFKTFDKMKKIVNPVLCFTNAVVNENSRKVFSDVLITSTDDIVKTIEGCPQLLELIEVNSVLLYLKKNARYVSCREIGNKY